MHQILPYLAVPVVLTLVPWFAHVLAFFVVLCLLRIGGGVCGWLLGSWRGDPPKR